MPSYMVLYKQKSSGVHVFDKVCMWPSWYVRNVKRKKVARKDFCFVAVFATTMVNKFGDHQQSIAARAA